MSSSTSSSRSAASNLVSTFLTANSPSNLSGWRVAEKAMAVVGVVLALNQLRKVKMDKLISVSEQVKQVIPGVAGAVNSTIESETSKAVLTMFPSELTQSQTLAIPEKGLDYTAILEQMSSFRKFDPKSGRVFGYMYETCDEEYEHFLTEAFTMYMHENGLNPTAFPALRKFEVEVAAMTLNMLHAPPKAVGTMTSGGTESLLLTVKTYRDRARELYPHITKPEIVMAQSIHVAMPKACAYFDVIPVYVAVDENMQMDVAATARAITPNTIALVVSAPQYPHGVVDPVSEIAALALKHKLPVHVDACMGGFLLPWVEKLGYEVPLWDFRVPGVTSISADIHKYGYAAKGASTLLWLSQEYRQYQFFSCATWPGGMFVSPSMLGTRPGGAIAAAYAALLGNGEAGYLSKAKQLMECSKALQVGIAAIPEFRILGKPHMSIISWTAKPQFEKQINIFAVADVMSKKFKFQVECQQNPTCLHVTLTPPHFGVVDEFLDCLRLSVAEVRAHPELVQEGSAATYGLVAQIPSKAIVDKFLVSFLDKVLQPSKTK